MRQSTSGGICWQQGREEASEDVEWMRLCEGSVTGNQASCGMGGVVQRPYSYEVDVFGWVAGFRWPGDT